MSEQLRVKGHTLQSEGRAMPYIPGPAICSCGWRSQDLTSDGQRKRAHKDHKIAVLKRLGR
jgi:hypothetical protein